MAFMTAIIIACGAPYSALAEEEATVAEVVERVRAAAIFLSQKGEEGLGDFKDSKGPWVWKDTYVFVYNCGDDVVAGHVNRKLVGYRISEIVDREGNYLGLELCAAADNPGGSWVEYWWPKVGSMITQRKISFIMKVPGQPFEVGAGLYDSQLAIKDLNARER